MRPNIASASEVNSMSEAGETVELRYSLEFDRPASNRLVWRHGAYCRVSDEQLRQRTPDGEFSLIENVCHLRDIEVEGYALRIRRILNEDLPLLMDIDGGRLAAERDYNQQNANDVLRSFAEAREANAKLLLSLSPAQLRRAGTLAGVGEIQLQQLLIMMRDHDTDHLRQMSAARHRSQLTTERAIETSG
jgi:hypothetical protein